MLLYISTGRYTRRSTPNGTCIMCRDPILMTRDEKILKAFIDIVVAELKERDGSICSPMTHRARAIVLLSSLFPDHNFQDADCYTIVEEAKEEMRLLHAYDRLWN